MKLNKTKKASWPLAQCRPDRLCRVHQVTNFQTSRRGVVCTKGEWDCHEGYFDRELNDGCRVLFLGRDAAKRVASSRRGDPLLRNITCKLNRYASSRHEGSVIALVNLGTSLHDWGAHFFIPHVRGAAAVRRVGRWRIKMGREMSKVEEELRGIHDEVISDICHHLDALSQDEVWIGVQMLTT
jgi:hypothetical protein